MKSPKGFGKNYFTFSSILAHTSQSKLESQVASLSSFLHNKQTCEDAEFEEEDPPLEILETFIQSSTKPCHCNFLFTLKTKLTILCNTYIPRCPYYTTYFAFRRTGVHPPFYPSH